MHLNIGLSVGKYLGVLKSIEYGLCDEKEYAWMGYKWAYGQKLRCEKDTVPSSTSTSAIDDPVPASGGEGQQHGKNVTEVMWLGWRCMLTM